MAERAPYEVGSFVIPLDLPRRFVCYVTNACWVGRDDDQLLELQPLEGPWEAGTRLIRIDQMVRHAMPAEIGLVRRRSEGDAPRARAREQRTAAHDRDASREEQHARPSSEVA